MWVHAHFLGLLHTLFAWRPCVCTLQDTCARLSEAEAALRDTEAALEASRAAAAATAAQLEEAAAELAARGEEAVGLAGRLAEAEAALSEREEEGRRLGREVEHLKVGGGWGRCLHTAANTAKQWPKCIDASVVLHRFHCGTICAITPSCGVLLPYPDPWFLQ